MVCLTLMMSFLAILPSAGEDYELPMSLQIRDNGAIIHQRDGLHRTDSNGAGVYSLDYMVRPAHHKVKIRYGDETGTHLKDESTNYWPVTAAPVGPDKLYVLGTDDKGWTRVEKWTIEVIRGSEGARTIETSREPLFSKKELTHILCAVVYPNEAFMLAVGLEADVVYRIKLPTGEFTVMCDEQQYPHIAEFHTFTWIEHHIYGDMFLLSQGSVHAARLNAYYILWDDDLDGVPELIEGLTTQQWKGRGYNRNMHLMRPYKDWWGLHEFGGR